MAVLTAIFSAVYLRTGSPTIWFGDTAEFQTIAYLGGLGHATGYPLYLALAKLFVYFPLGSPAPNLNAMSALFGVLTVLTVYLLAHRITGSAAGSMIAAALVGCGNTFWKQTSLAEVYTLHAFLFTLVLYLLIVWHKGGRSKWLCAGTFLFALSLGNHLTMILVLPGFLYLMVASRRDHNPATLAKPMLTSAIAALIGIVIVIMLYYMHDQTASTYDHLRAIEMLSPESWGRTAADFDSFWERLWYLATASQFTGNLLHVDSTALAQNFQTFLSIIPGNLGWPGATLAVAGLAICLMRQRVTAVFVIIVGLTFLGYDLLHGIMDIDVYYIPIWIIGAVAVGIGVGVALEWVRRLSIRMIPKMALVVIFTAILAPILWHSEQIKALQEGHPPGIPDPTLAYRETKPVVDRLEDNAIVFALWHQFHVIGYIALVEQERTGISLHELYPAGESYRFSNSYMEYIAENIATRPIYLTYPVPRLEQLYRMEELPPLYRLRTSVMR